MNSFESYFDVDHREQAKRKQQNCLLKSRTRLRYAAPWQAGRTRLRFAAPWQAGRTRLRCAAPWQAGRTLRRQGFGGQAGQTICRGISSFAVGMIIGWMAGTITYCMIHIITK